MNHTSIAFFSAVVAICCASASPADARVISGRVLDENRSPVPFATVVVVGTKLSIHTDEQGIFRISDVPPGLQKIRVFVVGYEPVVREIAAGRETVTTVTVPFLRPMIPDEGELSVDEIGAMARH